MEKLRFWPAATEAISYADGPMKRGDSVKTIAPRHPKDPFHRVVSLSFTLCCAHVDLLAWAHCLVD